MNSIGNIWLTPAFMITLVIIVGCTVVGIKRGFIKTVFDLFGMIAALILTILISPYVANAMRNSPSIYDAIHSKIEEHVHINFNLSNNTLSDYLEGLNLPEKVDEFLLKGGETVTDAANGTVSQVNAAITDKLTHMAISCIAFIITYIIIMVLILILSMVLNLISKLPILNSLNKTLGAVAGLIEAYVILSVIGVIIMAASTSKTGIAISEQIASNPILSFIYKHNLILIGITKFKGMIK
ncbi:MAG: CvpA family protein [Lachnospiraceae bacterium]|nr:CvpA family protein [Lachnospiraceae bacterium]